MYVGWRYAGFRRVLGSGVLFLLSRARDSSRLTSWFSSYCTRMLPRREFLRTPATAPRDWKKQSPTKRHLARLLGPGACVDHSRSLLKLDPLNLGDEPVGAIIKERGNDVEHGVTEATDVQNVVTIWGLSRGGRL